MANYGILPQQYNGTTYDTLYFKNNLSGTSNPTTSTVAYYVGQLYINTSTGNMFKCTAISAPIYTWLPIGNVTSVNGKIPNSSGAITLASSDIGITIASGSWTPVFGGLNGTTVTKTDSYLYAKYYRIGNVCFINMEWSGTITNLNGSDYAVIRGLPYVSQSFEAQVNAPENSGITDYPASLIITSGTFAIALYYSDGLAAQNWSAASSTTRYLSLSGWYFV